MSPPTAQTHLKLDEAAPPLITRIEVENLFGFLSYDIRSPHGPDVASDVLILYGDNGTGKTSILRLLFYVLSAADRRGHKTQVAQTNFSRFAVSFSNRLQVVAERPEGSFIGTFHMSVRAPSNTIAEFLFETRPDGSIKIEDPKGKEQLRQFFDVLGKLATALFYLKDDRSIETTLYRDPEEQEEFVLGQWAKAQQGENVGTAIAIRATTVALSKAADWVRTQAFRASNRGETNTYNVYLEIVKRLTASSQKRHRTQPVKIGNVLQRLKEIAARSEELARLGLISRVDVSEMSSLLRQMPQPRAAILEQVVSPYVDAMTARFKALDWVASALEKFLRYLNTFYRNKQIAFDLHHGFVISGPNAVLDPAMLSSGERHLLLLFCNVLVAEERPSLFIIDEPELSLNVRWQRLLIKALIDCVKDSHVSFIFATHSMELLAQHRRFVRKLETPQDTSRRKARKHERDSATS